MPPAEQTVQVPELLIKLVVPFRTDQHRLDQTAGSFPDSLAQRPNTRVRGNSFAVLNARVQKVARDASIDIHARNHQRSKKIALSAFIHAEMRLEHLRRMYFLVTQFRFTENFRLELELHKLLHAFALHQNLWPLL